MEKQPLFWSTNLRHLRSRKKWSQDELAEKLEITRSKLNAHENGKTINPTAEDLIAVRQGSMAMQATVIAAILQAIATDADIAPFADAGNAMAEWSRGMPALFPPGTEVGNNTQARAVVWSDRAGHAFAISHAAFSANFDFEDGFIQSVIVGDLHVSELKLPGFIRPETGIDHEQHEVMELFALPFVSNPARFLRAFARRLIEKFVFIRREPCAVGDLA